MNLSEQNWTAVKCRCGDAVCKQHIIEPVQRSIGFDPDVATLIVAAPRMAMKLLENMHTFRKYEALHRAKGTPEGDEKAAANRRRAEEIRQLLNEAGVTQ